MTQSKNTQHLRQKRLRRIRDTEAELERAISDSFSLSCMSDSKWKRLFDAATNELITCCKWKFVSDNRSWTTDLPEGSDIKHGYYSNCYGYFRLKHVEWIELITDDPETLSQALMRSGQFELGLKDNGLLVHGYRARQHSVPLSYSPGPQRS